MGMRRWAARNKGRVVGHSAVVAHWHGWVGVWGAASCLRVLEQSGRGASVQVMDPCDGCTLHARASVMCCRLLCCPAALLPCCPAALCYLPVAPRQASPLPLPAIMSIGISISNSARCEARPADDLASFCLCPHVALVPAGC
jgi:hypothetical protein